MNEQLDVTWYCPNCNEQNVDNFGDTTFPTCSECMSNYQWDDILTDEQFNKLNPLLVEYRKTSPA